MRKPFFEILLLSLPWILFPLLLVSVGLTTQVSLGDEVYHYRFAKAMFNAGHRVLYDPIFPSGFPPGYFYVTEPLWNGVLALLWKALGRVSFPLAQLYQGGCYVLFLAAGFALALTLYRDRRLASWSAFLLATMPMSAAFGMLFYVDLPASAFSTFSLTFLLKSWHWSAGILFGLTYLTKRLACLLVPVFFLLILFRRGRRVTQRLADSLAFLIPGAILMGMDLGWRETHFPSGESLHSGAGTLAGLLGSLKLWHPGASAAVHPSNSSLTHWIDVVKYFGIPLLAGLFLYLFVSRDKKRDLLLWLAAGFYFGGIVYLLGIHLDLRYLFPIVPLLTLLAARGLEAVPWRPLRILAIGICLAQFVTTALFVEKSRRISPAIEEGFRYLKENTPAGTFVVYPEENIMERAERPVLWGRMKEYKRFFWPKEESEFLEIARLNGIHYIAVKKSRVVDDAFGRHIFGYPRSFVGKLAHFSSVERVFENSEMAIYRIR